MLADTVTSACCSTKGSAKERAARSASSSCLALVAEVFAQHHELVAAEPRNRVLAANGRAESAAHGDEEFVARLVTEAVVHQLEAVEVDEQHRDRRVGVGQTGDRVLEPVLGQSPVGEPGQGVVQRQVPEAAGVLGAVDGERHEVARALHECELGG